MTLHAELDRYLNLHHPSRKQPSLLHRGEIILGKTSFAKRSGQNASCGNRILDGEVHADTAGRRHRMGRIPDAKQAGCPPTNDAIESDRKETCLPPIMKGVQTFCRKGKMWRDPLLECIKPRFPQLEEAAFQDDETATPSVSPVINHHAGTLVHVLDRDNRIIRQTRQPEPDHIDPRAKIHDLETGLMANDRLTTIRSDHERRLHLPLWPTAPRGIAPRPE